MFYKDELIKQSKLTAGSMDVIIIGGSFAGLTAALYLARARRSVLVLDSREPRNRYSSHSHGVFALDGKPGSELLEVGRAQLAKYPTATQLQLKVTRITKESNLFHVETEDKQHFQSRKLILATGLIDERPDLQGLEERWGKTIFHCPYCDGYEIGGGSIGVIATLPVLSVHVAKLLTDWGNVTFFVSDAIKLDNASRNSLAKKGVSIEERKITRLEGLVEGPIQVVLGDGARIEVKSIFIVTKFRMAAPFAKELGCALISTPRGEMVQTDDWKMTTVNGVYAAGDISRMMHSIPFATADGAIAGAGAHQSLVAEED
jgi:thioredoxin reductase